MDIKAYRFLQGIKPFQLLPEPELRELVGQLIRKEYPPGAIIYSRKSPISFVSILLEGEAQKFQLEEDKERRFIENILPGETFGEISILLNQGLAVCSVEATKAAIIYDIPADSFINLCQRHHFMSNYITDRIGKRMFNDAYDLYRFYKKEELRTEPDIFFTQKIKSIQPRELVVSSSESSIRDVAKKMSDERIGCVLIQDPSGNFIGYVTDLELRDKVIVTGLDANQPVQHIVANPIFSIPDDALVHEALLKMFQEKINYLVVSKKGRFNGILNRNKLLSSKAKSPFVLIQSIKLAITVPELKSKWRNVPFIVKDLIEKGTRVEVIGRLITAFIEAIVFNVVEKSFKEVGEAPVKFSYLGLGSMARNEATLKVTQYSGIIFEDTDSSKRDAIQNYFLTISQSIGDALEEIGFAYSKQQLGATNPRWCLTLQEWKNQFSQWIFKPTRESINEAIVFFDVRCVYGDSNLVEELNQEILKLLTTAPNLFFELLYKKAQENETPLTWLKGFQMVHDKSGKSMINLRMASLPLVDFARILSLKGQISAISTDQRLNALLEKRTITKKEFYEFHQAFHFMMNLRIKYQVKALTATGETLSNLIDPDRLTNIERVTLKEVFKLVEEYLAKVSSDSIIQRSFHGLARLSKIKKK